jgi:hypothetical protein
LALIALIWFGAAWINSGSTGGENGRPMSRAIITIHDQQTSGSRIKRTMEAARW